MPTALSGATDGGSDDFGSNVGGQSLQRVPDGSTTIVSSVPTPAAANVGQTTTLSFDPTSATVDENAGTINIPVVLTTSDGAVTTIAIDGTVDISGGSGSAADVTDSPTDKTVSFPSGTASGTTVNAQYTINDDGDIEGAETLEFSLTSTDADLIGAGTYTLTINDNDAVTVVFSVAAGSIDEGDATSVDVVLNVPGGGQVGTAVSGDILIQGGTNADEIDTFTGSFSFASTATDGATETISITTVDDSPLDDGPQDVTFAFDNLSGAVAGTPTSFVLTVQDINGPQPGDLVITEFMADPSVVTDGNGEYIEIHNTTGSSIDLNGFVITDDGSNTHTIGSSVTVPASGFAVLCRNSTTATNGGVTCDYQYTGFTLNNGSDAINLSDGGTRIARVSYSSGTAGNAGVALELRALSLVAPDGVVRRSTRISLTGGRSRPFVDATAQLAGGDFGSPGAFGNTATNNQAMTLGNIQGGGADANLDGQISEAENEGAAAGDIGWYLLSLPATDATMNDLATSQLVQGVDNYYDDDVEAANIYTDYDGTSFIEPGTDAADDKGAAGSLSDTKDYEFVAGRGFIWFHYDNDLVPTKTTDNQSNSVAMPYTLDVSARTAPSSDVSVSFGGRTTDFYMLGNPFPGSFVLSGISPTGGDINDNVEVYDPFSDSYRTPLSISAGDTLGAFSGFFLEAANANQASGVTFQASSVTTGGTIFGRETAPVVRRRLGFQLVGENTSLGAATYDEAAVLQFHPLASEGDDLFDGTKLYPLTGVYGIIGLVGQPEDGPVLRSVESRPYDSGDFEVELDVQTTVNGTFTLTWPLQEDLPASWNFELEDRATGTTVDLRETSAYTFAVTGAPQRITAATLSAARQTLPASLRATPSWTQEGARSTGPRFVLRVMTNGVANEDDSLAKGYRMTAIYPNPFNPQAQFSLTLDESQAVRAEVFDALGRRVAILADGMQTAGTTTYRIDGQRLASGVYVVRVAGETFVETQRVTLVK
ncbi:MAG: lamin tail domain-containing protein [Bacteroidota bacterium]